MMMRHAPPSPSARVAYYFSPVLPAWPWMTWAYLVLHHCRHRPHHLGKSILPAWRFSTDSPCLPVDWPWDWLLCMGPWKCSCDAKTTMHTWTFVRFLDLFCFTYFSLHCGMNMLGMFCVRACSGLMGFRAATCIQRLHSFSGITAAQVGIGLCVAITVCNCCIV